MSFFILALTLNYQVHSWGSCQQKLEQKIWPLDCFLALNVQKYSEKSTPYKRLDEWCSLYEDILVPKRPPEALFSLRLPKECLRLALKSKRHHESLELLEGRFLNSFL